MNANDVIESYVTDVAVQLPRKQRNDVAFELRALIAEALQDKAEASGRAVDAAMATEFLQGFGRPEDVAARYRPTLTVIDPADGHAFVRAVVIGLAVIWSVGLFTHLLQPIGSTAEFLGVLAQWWGSTVVFSMWWPGMLALSFGLSSWTRRRWPQTSAWKPRASDRIVGSRATLVLGIVGMLCGLYVLIDPRWVLDFFGGGRAAPAAYQALTYTDTFLHRQAPCLFVLVALNVPLSMAVIVKGRWSPSLRRLETALGLLICAAMTWTILDGPMFMASASDQTAKFFMVLIVAFTLIYMGMKLHRSVRPSPSRPTQAWR